MARYEWPRAITIKSDNFPPVLKRYAIMQKCSIALSLQRCNASVDCFLRRYGKEMYVRRLYITPVLLLPYLTLASMCAQSCPPQRAEIRA